MSGADCLQKISTKEKNYVATGFEARSDSEEPKCVDLELNVLMSIEDVTSRVNARGEAGRGFRRMPSGPAARRSIEIEKESFDKTGLRSNVIPLYNGGLYQLYRYKRYTDVRLVFAPQKAIAFFGGDPDNFEYPRYDLDICFFRVYENDKPVHVDDYLKWSESGAAEGDLIFVSGNPGRTERQDTVAHLEYQRDYSLPSALNLLRRREVLLENYSERSAENARRAEDELFGIKNSRKAYLGMLAGLQDPAIMDKKRAAEKTLRDAVNSDRKTKASLRRRVGSGRRISEDTGHDPRRIQPDRRGARPGIQQRLVLHRQDAGAPGGGIRQAQQRTSSRIFGSGP